MLELIAEGTSSMVYKAVDMDNQIFVVKKYKYYSYDSQVLSNFQVK